MIRPATPADLPAIRRLLQGIPHAPGGTTWDENRGEQTADTGQRTALPNPRSPVPSRYFQESRQRFLTCGLEDLPEMLHSGMAAVGTLPGEANDLWGFLLFEGASPQVLPGALQDGALRAAAISPQIPPNAGPAQLLAQILTARQAPARPLQLTALTAEDWLVRLLQDQGFAVVDHLGLYQRTRRSLPPAALSSARLRPLALDEIPALMALDSHAFPPLWRMSEADIAELCFTCRVQAAEVDGQLAGYAAIALHPDPDGYDENEAQFTRLAVHPGFQGRGIGRQLGVDSIAYAHANRCYRVLLNTPESNQAAQRLYASLHFRRHGALMPVLVYSP